MQINNILKILLPTTGILFTATARLYFCLTEQLEAKNLKLSELVKEKNDLALTLTSQNTPSSTTLDLYLKISVGLVIGVGITLVFYYTPTLNLMLKSLWGKLGVLTGLNVKVGRLHGLDSNNNEVLAELTGEDPGIISIFFGSNHEEVCLGTLIPASKVLKSNYDSILLKLTEVQSENIKLSSLYDDCLIDLTSKIHRIKDLDSQISNLEIEISRLSSFDVLGISTSEALTKAAELFN